MLARLMQPLESAVRWLVARDVRVALLLLVLAFAVFWPTLDNGFVLDDVYMVQHNEVLRELSNVPQFYASTPPGAINRGYYRPTMLASFALDYALFGGQPRGYHAENIAWHAACAFFVFLLLQHFVQQRLASVLGALLFLVHPLQGEVVYLITYRATALSACFAFAALLYYLRRRAEPFGVREALVLAALMFVSVTAKEMGVVLPFLMLACDLFVPAQRRPQLAPYAATALALAAFWLLRHLLCEPSSASYFGASSGERVLRAMVVVEAYVLGLLVLPRGLAATYDASHVYEPSHFADPVWLAACALLVGCAVIAFRLRRRVPLVSLAIAIYFIALGPTYNILRSPNLFGDRFVYSALLGFCLLVCVGVLALARTRARGVAVALVALVALTGLAAQTHARAYEWRDEESVWRSIVAARPASLQAHVGMATTLFHLRKFEQAMPHFEAALRFVSGASLRDRSLFGETVSCYSQVGNLPAALALVERWLAMHPEDEGFQQMHRTLKQTLARRAAQQAP